MEKFKRLPKEWQLTNSKVLKNLGIPFTRLVGSAYSA